MMPVMVLRYKRRADELRSAARERDDRNGRDFRDEAPEAPFLTSLVSLLSLLSLKRATDLC